MLQKYIKFCNLLISSVLIALFTSSCLSEHNIIVIKLFFKGLNNYNDLKSFVDKYSTQNNQKFLPEIYIIENDNKIKKLIYPSTPVNELRKTIGIYDEVDYYNDFLNFLNFKDNEEIAKYLIQENIDVNRIKFDTILNLNRRTIDELKNTLNKYLKSPAPPAQTVQYEMNILLILTSTTSNDDRYLTVRPDRVVLDSRNNDVELEINSNTNWTINTRARWITLRESGGTGNRRLIVNVSENSSTIPRNDSLIITSIDNNLRSVVFIYQNEGRSNENSYPPPTGLRITENTCNGFTISWNRSRNARFYLLDISRSESFVNFVQGFRALNVGNVDAYTVNNLEQGRNYYIRLRTDYGEAISDFSRIISVTTRQGPVLGSNVSLVGNLNPCAFSSQIYELSGINENLNILWSLPAGWNMLEQLNRNASKIRVKTGSSGDGVLRVKAINDCGESNELSFSLKIQPIQVNNFYITPDARTFGWRINCEETDEQFIIQFSKRDCFDLVYNYEVRGKPEITLNSNNRLDIYNGIDMNTNLAENIYVRLLYRGNVVGNIIEVFIDPCVDKMRRIR